jgi:hypothetical protein
MWGIKEKGKERGKGERERERGWRWEVINNPLLSLSLSEEKGKWNVLDVPPLFIATEKKNILIEPPNKAAAFPPSSLYSHATNYREEERGRLCGDQREKGRRGLLLLLPPSYSHMNIIIVISTQEKERKEGRESGVEEQGRVINHMLSLSLSL